MENIKEESINNIKVKPVIISTTATNELNLGYAMFNEIYANIVILSKKRSGKTNLIFNIIKKCANKNTRVNIFSSTVHKDATYGKIIEYLDKKDIEYTAKTSFIEEIKEGKKYVKNNLITEWIEEMKKGNQSDNDEDETTEEETDQADQEQEQQYQEQTTNINFSFKKCLFQQSQQKTEPEPEPQQEEDEEIEKPKKKRKSKYLSPEYMFIFDDLGTLLRDPSINQLCKIMRHFKMKIIISSQRLTDCHPDSIAQMDYCLIFKSFNDETLNKLREKLDLSLEKDEFQKIYDYATKDQYNFLYIDVGHNLFRKNFNKKIELSQ